MILKKTAALLAALALIGAAPVEAPLDASANRIRADVQFLSSDELEGRDTGSVGYRIAAQYVASQFAANGLKPGGAKDSWFLDVPFRRATHVGEPKVAVKMNGSAVPLAFGKDVAIRPSLTEQHRALEVGLVFAGQGINDPVLGINDYAGVDARGKIALVVEGTPAGVPSEVGAHLQSSKAAMALRAGAIGVIILPIKDSGAARVGNYAKVPILDWHDASGQTGDAGILKATMAISAGAAQQLLQGSAWTFDRIKAAYSNKQKIAAFALPAQLSVQADSVWQDFTSPEVIGVLPGSDPSLAAQHVVLMGHLDHLGVKPDAKPGEDRIYNGALDNAAGVATMLEVARKFASAPKAARRSLMFIANTGEERGLLGADYFASHPTVPAESIVGLVDLDMPLLLYDFTDVAAFGAEHSTIARTAAAASESMGIKISPDPMPEQTLFVRSDHYRFVLRGVPAVFLMTGFANGGKKAYADYFARGYHAVNDDMRQPIRWAAGGRYAELNYRISRALADADARPMWYSGDYFGDRFAPGQAKAAK
ncbi:MAG: M20/M25/M40 family metallo-hydrolase [Sphingomicrobium sp.]